MSIIRVYNTASKTGKRLINLSFVSTIHQYNNKIVFYKSNERNNIIGNFLFMTGGQSAIEEITCDSPEIATQEFAEITKILQDYYKK